MLFLDPEVIASLRTDLQAADWTVDTVEQMMGPMAAAALDRGELVPARMALAKQLAKQATPAAILTKLFLLAEPVSPQQLALAFPTCDVTRIGMVDQGRALVDLRPHAWGDTEWWICSDLGEVQTGKPISEEHVLGIGRATLSLLRMTVREPVERALDLGTGCGILALYLSTHAQQVVATDISERACQFARFNAALNQADNIEVRQGSLFGPVSGERFDLITTNPPFVITPQSVRESRFMEYRDGGMDRDNLVATIISHAHEYLNEGGMVQMLANWEVADPKVWWERPCSWLPEGTRTWLVQRDLLDPAQYVEMWLRDSGEANQEDIYRQWLEDFGDVAGVGMGFLALTRSTPTVVVAEEIVDGELPDSQTVRAAVDALELPQDWWDRPVLLVEDVREERHYHPGTPDPQVISLTQGSGMGRKIRVSSSVAAWAGVAEGELTSRQIAAALAALTGTDLSVIESELAEAIPQLLRARMAFLVDAC